MSPRTAFWLVFAVAGVGYGVGLAASVLFSVRGMGF